MIGKILSHFRILEKVGEGGMGVVYRARDESLDRDVALKVLPAGSLAIEAGRKRFKKEALALSRLNHPNIETVHAFETQDGVDFLVMELIPGMTLDEKLAAGPFPEKEVALLGAQLAEGLAAAHAAGVVHRDLKPGNLRLTPDGRLKILDFGLAKWLQPAGDLGTTEKPTETGGAGTLPYMAPEQLRQEGIDPRSDIYAAGVVLYEMATGRRPFPQTSPPRLIEAILNAAPAAPRVVNPRIASNLETIILKALDKDPGRRYQTARELHVDLARLASPGLLIAAPRRSMKFGHWLLLLGGGAGTMLLGLALGLNVGGLRNRIVKGFAPRPIRSLAVLPLANLSGDPEQEYFADGITEELTTSLAQIRSLRVISRTSAMRFKDSRRPLSEIARKLNVEAIVEGSVRMSGDRVRVTAQLIDTATDRHLWARSYERGLRDVLSLQSEVAQNIAREINAKLTPQEQVRLATARAVRPEVYQTYLKGRYLLNKTTEDDLKKAILYFERTIEEQPELALGYAGLAETYVQLGTYEFLPPEVAYPKAKAAATGALQRDDALPEAHVALANVMYSFDWDWEGVEREAKRAIELNPNYAWAHKTYGDYLAVMGRTEEAIAEYKRADDLDPLSVTINSSMDWCYYAARRYDEAIDQSRGMLEVDPNSDRAHAWLGLTYLQKKQFDEAIVEIQKAIAVSGGSTEHMASLGYAYALTGRREEAQRVIDQLNELAPTKYVAPIGIAYIYVGLGDTNQAFAWMERGYHERDGWINSLKVDPRLDPLRSDPRFHDLIARVGLPLD